MWYVIQTLGGEEERTAGMIRKMVSSYSIEDCFVPKRERLRKFCGCWNRVEEVLFPGYVFVEAHNPGGLYEELRQIPRLTSLLGREDGWFLALNQKEEELVRGIGDEKHKTSLSKVVVDQDKRIRVADGPLKDYAGDVVKVDLHRREVTVRVEFMGRKMDLKMGIEMTDRGQ